MNTLVAISASFFCAVLGQVQTASTSSAPHAHHGAGSDHGPVPDLESFVQIALDTHPSIKAQRLRALAARERVEPAGVLRDPMFTVGFVNNPIDRIDFRATPMTGIQLGLAQHLPWPGKLALSRHVAAEMAAAAGASTDEQRNAIALAVRMVYFDIHLTDVSIAVARKNLQILEDFVSIADAKYRVGKGLQQDVLKARVQRDQIAARVVAFARARSRLRIRLNSLLVRPESTEVPALIDVPVRAFDDSVTAEALVGAARKHRPKLAALERKIAAASAMRDLADKQVMPDFTVGAGYRIRFPRTDPVDGANFWSLNFGMNLPVFAGIKQGPLARAARDEAAAAQEELAVALLDIQRIVDDELAQLPSFIEQMELYRTAIIPNTQQSLESDRIAYQVDRVDFLNLLDIEMRLFNFEVDYHRLHVAREQAIARIAHAVGVPPGDLKGAIETQPGSRP